MNFGARNRIRDCLDMTLYDSIGDKHDFSSHVIRHKMLKAHRLCLLYAFNYLSPCVALIGDAQELI